MYIYTYNTLYMYIYIHIYTYADEAEVMISNEWIGFSRVNHYTWLVQQSSPVEHLDLDMLTVPPLYLFVGK